MTVETAEISTVTTEAIPAGVVQDDIADLSAAYNKAMNGGTERDETGRFVARNSPPAEVGATPVDGEGAGAVDAASTVATSVPAPAHLPQAIKAHWDKYGPEAQAAIADHQAEMDRKFGEVGKYKPISDKIVSAAQQFPEFRGLTPDQIADGAIRLAAVQTALEKSPESAVSTLIEVAKSYNVLPQLAQLFAAQQGSPNHTAELQQKLAQLEAQVAKAGSPDFIREQITSTMTERETEASVRTFIASDGVKEFWPDVEAHIPSFIRLVKDEPANSGKSPQEILATAYDMAINAIPAVREKVRATEARATAAGADPKRTEQLRKAASINVKSTSGGTQHMTEQEALADAYRRSMAN